MNWLIILTVKSILSSIIGSSFYKWFQDTAAGVWFQVQVNRFMEYFAERYDIELAKTESKFKKQYPLIAERLEALEENAHPPIPMECFDGFEKLEKRIEKLEKK